MASESFYEMKPENEADLVDVEMYRKIVRNFIDLRRYKTALFWAEKVSCMTNNDPIDVYWQAQCMYLLKEYHRAAYIIRLNELEKKNLLCHYLAADCLLQSKEYQEALDILNSVEVEELTTSLINNYEESLIENLISQDELRTEVLASIFYLKGQILEAMDNRNLAMDSYVQSLHKSVYCTEALDSLVQHEMLLAWEERQLLKHIPIDQQCSENGKHIINLLYESKLKKYVASEQTHSDPLQTPGEVLSPALLYEFSEKMKNNRNNEMRVSKNKNITSVYLTTPIQQIVSPPVNTFLNDNDIRNTPSFSMQSSLSRIVHDTSSNRNDSSYHIPSKFKKQQQHQNKHQTQSFLFNIHTCLKRLESSADLLVAQAERLYYNCDFRKCLKLTDTILKKDPYQTKTLIVLIETLVELKDFNKLFSVAHKLIDLYPDEAISWYAVGCYYDLIGKSDPARRYLSKATTLDRLFGPAWLAYGHSFAKENEHDQAMAAYFKATQLMRGCHLPLLYIGVECGLTKNLEMAEKFFYQAMSLAPLDVFVLHELGSMKYEYEMYESAEEIYRTTLEMVQNLAKRNGDPITPRWEPLLNNLGHCCRKNKKYKEALDFHRQALFLKPLSSTTYTAMGLVQALMGQLDSAIESFHKSLSLKRDDAVTMTILKTVLEDWVEETSQLDEKIDIVEKYPTVDTEGDAVTENQYQLNCLKLKFEDDSDTLDNSFDMSMDV